MKKIFLTFTLLALVVFAYSCSKDHESPTFSQFEVAKKPTNVVATYNATANAFTVTWNMQDPTDVIDYYVTVADSSSFEGINKQFAVGSAATTYTIPVNFIPNSPAVRYFAVSAIYSNDTVKTFIGPRSDVADSALYVR